VRFGVVAFVLIVVAFVLVSRLVPPRARLPVWILIVLAGVVPWSSWMGHAHWDGVEWVPFTRNVRLRDVVLNVLFYAPIGYFLAARRASTRRNVVVTAAVVGFALSVATELSQVFSHGRFPAMTDVVSNLTGAVIGAWVGRVRAR